MSSNLDVSVTLITSESSENPDFGSGFVIHQEGGTSFILTCAHVVRDVGGVTSIKIGTNLATVVGLGEEKGCDLAVLKVDGLSGKTPLKLCNSASEGKRIVIAGYYQNETRVKTLRKISGVIGERIVLELNEDRTTAWDIEIDENSKYFLQPGYSGSPVVDEQTGATIGVISQREREGRQGLAISIESLRKIWQELPSSLIQNELSYLREEAAIEERTIQESNIDIDQIESDLRRRGDQKFDKSLSWLSDNNRTRLAARVGKEALKQLPNSVNQAEEYCEQFYEDIEMYLELVYFSLVTRRLNLLREPVVSQSHPTSAIYRLALHFVKDRIPEDIVEDERKELEARITYLISRLP